MKDDTQETVEVWQANLDDLDNRAPVLSPQEFEQAKQIKNARARHSFMATRSWLRHCLASYLAQAPEAIQIQRTVHGKPFLADYPDVFFNLSHSKNVLLLAVARQAVGIDVEVIRTRSGFTGLVKKCFTHAEQQYWNNLPESQQIQAFYQFWTGKEAFVKAVGRGIALGMNNIELNLDGHGKITAIPEVYGQPDNWQLQYLTLGKELSAAVCVQRAKNCYIQYR